MNVSNRTESVRYRVVVSPAKATATRGSNASPAPARLAALTLSRRTLVGAGAIAALGWHAGLTSTRATRPEPTRPVGAWSTWLLASASELRPAAPSAVTAGEVAALLQLQSERDDRSLRIVSRWGRGPSVLPWTSLALELIEAHAPSPARASRALALLHVAIHDAVIASWDAQLEFRRPPPSVAEPAITPLDAFSLEHSSYPSEHAAVAGAAALVLEYLFPEASARWLAALAEEAGFSRLRAGTNYRSDVEAGFALGRIIGARAVARGEGDGAAAPWDGSERPTGEGYWQPTPPEFIEPPLDPLAGTWQPWLLATGSEFRPAPPPVYRSPAWRAELAAVQHAVAARTPRQEDAARFWAGGPGTVTPAGIWTGIARDLIVRDGLDGPHAARVLALVAVAMADAFICCWDAKYTFWTVRPITVDPGLDVVIPTPPFPSYTSGHATISAAAATVLGHLFPGDAEALTDQAIEAKNSRLWAGIHFPIDNDMGATMGGMVGRLAVDRGRAGGAEGA